MIIQVYDHTRNNDYGSLIIPNYNGRSAIILMITQLYDHTRHNDYGSLMIGN